VAEPEPYSRSPRPAVAVAVTDDLYDVFWHHGLFNAGFISAWLPAVGVMSGKTDAFWEGHRLNTVRHVLAVPAVHARMQNLNGEAIVTVLENVIHAHCPEVPFGQLWHAAAIEHPTHDDFWDARDSRPGLAEVDIPVYLGCDWENALVHLPSTFTAWEALRHNPNVRITMLPPGGLCWPWESLHEEALAWYDHWLRGVDTGIMDGPAVRFTLPGDRADGTDGSSDWRQAASWPPESDDRVFHLRGDGVLGDTDDDTDRQYLYLTADVQRPKNANPVALPDRLEWTAARFEAVVEFAGDITLSLHATVTAQDTAWIAVLYDRAPDGKRTAITGGWLRASHAHGECKPRPVPSGARATYGIPVVPNARHLATGHALALVITSSDAGHDTPAIMGFRHAPTGDSSVNTIHSSSRLTLPLLRAAH